MANLKTIRTDVVGSLQRPPGLKEARTQFDEGKISVEALRALEDDAVREAVRLQESVGLDVITDGEMRRLNFQDSFGAAVEGYDAKRSTVKGYENRVEGAAPLQRWEIKELHDHGTAVSGIAARPGRGCGSRATCRSRNTVSGGRRKNAGQGITLIGPDRITQRFDCEDLRPQRLPRPMRSWPTWSRSSARSSRAWSRPAAATSISTRPASPPMSTRPRSTQMRARGEDPVANFALAQGRGEGGGEPRRGGERHPSVPRQPAQHVAPRRQLRRHRRAAVHELPHDRFLLEYDTRAPAVFAPLRFVPKGKVAVLGLVSTKVPSWRLSMA